MVHVSSGFVVDKITLQMGARESRDLNMVREFLAPAWQEKGVGNYSQRDNIERIRQGFYIAPRITYAYTFL